MKYKAECRRCRSEIQSDDWQYLVGENYERNIEGNPKPSLEEPP